MRGLVALAMVWACAAPAHAFCGMMVPVRPGQRLVNRSSMVVLARAGDRTVLTMRNDYEGPVEDFALVVPVPPGVRSRDVRTIEDSVFDRLEGITAPRLYDYDERDPCWNPNFPAANTPHRDLGVWVMGGTLWLRGVGTGVGRGGVDVESQFAVDEYDVTVLSASQSSALDGWLRSHGYHIPDGFEAAVRPYVEQGMHFFVARIAADRISLVDGRAVLSPLRITYTSEELTLPIRLGRLNADGMQDVVVHILAPEHRYEVASTPNVTIPTHYRVDESVRPSFESFYDELVDRTLEQNEGAAITEFASEVAGEWGWDYYVESRDLRALAEAFLEEPHERLDRTRPFRVERGQLEIRGTLEEPVIRRVVSRHVQELRYCYAVGQPRGDDVTFTFIISPRGSVQSAIAVGEHPSIESCLAQAVRRWTFPRPEGGGVVGVRYEMPSPWRGDAVRDAPAGVTWPSDTRLVLTRLRYRYGDDVRDDLVFRPAEPITGGTYTWARANEGPWMVRAARPHERNAFEARYFIGHPFQGEVSCGDSAVRGVWVPRSEPLGGISPYEGMEEDERPGPLSEIVLEDLFREDVPELSLSARVPAEDAPEPEAPPTELVPVGPQEPESSGCGCRAVGASGGGGPYFWLLVLLALRRPCRGSTSGGRCRARS